MFERSQVRVTRASWGRRTLTLARASRAVLPQSDPALAKLAGRYVNDSPWFGTAPVVERGGKLWIGTETPMTRDRRQSVAGRRGKLVARARVLRQLHRRAPANASSSRARSSSATTSRLGRRRRLGAPPWTSSKLPASPPKSSPSTASAPEEYDRILKALGREPNLRRARHLLGDVVGALQLQELARPPEDAADRRRRG